MAITRLFASFRSNILSTNFHRSISLSATRNLKEIRETTDGDTIIVEGIDVPHPKEHLMLNSSTNGACPLCSAGVDLKHTDVLILQQFLNSEGRMLPRRITGLCNIQQKRVGIMVAMAQKAGLMPNLAPPRSKKNPQKRFKWKAFNTYFDERTIKQNYY